MSADVMGLDRGREMRLSMDDWEKLCLYRGQRIPMRRDGRTDEWLFLAEVVVLPPLVWVVLDVGGARE